MDGNGRWAKKRGLPRTTGHIAGADNLKRIAYHAYDIGIKILTVYAFSTENWKRPADEVSALMKLFLEKLPKIEELLGGREVAVRFIGDISAFSPKLIKLMKEAEERTAKYEGGGNRFNFCVNYGGRGEIIHAVKAICNDALKGEIDVNNINEAEFEKRLYTHGIPGPDLVIRPSGEIRISNFLLWQSAYSEFYYDNILWPDYSPADLDRAITAFQKRDRRFGGV
jgi:undecaprenyl diphosphate synthase